MILALAVALAPAHPTQPQNRPVLEGSWRTGCMPIGVGGRHGFITTLTVRDRKLTAASQVYAHANCDTPTIRTVYQGRITAAKERAGGIDLDHVVGSVTMTLDAADVVTTYNKPGSGCGFGGGWQLGLARGVEGRSCAPFTFPTANTRLYERVWLEGGKLRLGSFPVAWTNTTPERRPATPGGLTFDRLPD